MSQKDNSTNPSLQIASRILVVEDSRVVHALIKKNIPKFTEDQISQTNNGHDAFKIVKESPYIFRVILLDLSMPVMGGMEFINQLRNLKDDKAKTTVISVTGNQDNLPQEELKEAKLNAVVIKPVNLDNVFKILSQAPQPAGDYWFGMIK